MKKKVLILADPDSIHTKKWVQGWERLGYECVVSGLSKKDYDDQLVFKAKIKIEGGNSFQFFRNSFKFRKVLQNESPDIINAHYLTSYGLVCALLKKKQHKMVLFLPGTDVMRTMDRNLMYLLVARYVFSKCSLLVSVSNTMTEKVLRYFPYLKDKIITQQYGIDTEMLDNFRKEDKDIDLLTNRAWVKNSNYEVLLPVFNEFRMHSMALIGYDQSVYADKLKARFPLLEKVIHPPLPYKENIAKVAGARIFISLTDSDGTPLSLLEAMYLGAVPIVSDLETNREIIEDGKNGFLVPIDDNRLYEEIISVLSLSEKELKNIREINKKLIEHKFQMKNNFRNMKSYLIKLNFEQIKS